MVHPEFIHFVGHGTQKSLWMENLLDPSEHDPGNFTYTMNCNANDADLDQTSSVNSSACHDDVAIPYEVNTKQFVQTSTSLGHLIN